MRMGAASRAWSGTTYNYSLQASVLRTVETFVDVGTSIQSGRPQSRPAPYPNSGIEPFMSIGNQHIGDIFRVLGTRRHRTALASPNTPFMYRSTWQCGCAVDYIDDSVGPFQWLQCAGHCGQTGAPGHPGANKRCDSTGADSTPAEPIASSGA